jgi:hypothetical protein
MVDRARGYFRCTDGERAVFEGAIKLSMVFHQFLGVPLSRATAPSLEKAIEEAVRLQPWVENVRVRIDRRMLGKGMRRYGYTTLDGSMLRLDVVTRYRTARAEVAMEFVRRMGYPLMFVRRVENGGVKKVYSRKPISDAVKSGSRGKRREHR